MQPSTRERWRELAALEGLIDEAVGRRLAELAAEVDDSLVVVELGSFKGKSTAYLAEGSRLGKGARVYAVEAWDHEGNHDGKFLFAQPETRKDFERQLKAVGLKSRVTVRQGLSADVGKAWGGRRVGLLYIDADHEYESVRDDFQAWLPHLAEGAVVAFDDYETTRNPGVTRYCDELREHGLLTDWTFDPIRLAVARLHT